MFMTSWPAMGPRGFQKFVCDSMVGFVLVHCHMFCCALCGPSQSEGATRQLTGDSGLQKVDLNFHCGKRQSCNILAYS